MWRLQDALIEVSVCTRARCSCARLAGEFTGLCSCARTLPTAARPISATRCITADPRTVRIRERHDGLGTIGKGPDGCPGNVDVAPSASW